MVNGSVESSTQTAPRVVGEPFPKGVSGNPGGRPKGLAAMVREATNDGEELVEALLKIVRSSAARERDKVAAANVLLERGWGKSQLVELRTEQPVKTKLDYNRLTIEQLRQLREIMHAAAVSPEESDGPPVEAA